MSNIPLDPKNTFGACIDVDSLQKADIIVSTTSQVVSKVIKGVTGSEVSHAMLYMGNLQVVESTSSTGVIVRSIYEALSDARLAVALRYPDLSQAKKDLIVDYVFSKIGSEYDHVGAASAGLQLEIQVPMSCYMIMCVGVIRPNSADKYFCSELILEGFEYAERPFLQATDGTPQDIVTAYENGKLDYVGHLLG